MWITLIDLIQFGKLVCSWQTLYIQETPPETIFIPLIVSWRFDTTHLCICHESEHNLNTYLTQGVCKQDYSPCQDADGV